MTPSYLVIFFKGDLLQMSSGLEVMLGFFSPSSVLLNYLEMISPSSVWLNSSGIVRILLSCGLARLKFAVLVIFDFRLGWKFPCLFPFLFCFIVHFCFSRTPYRFFSCFLSRGRLSVYFPVLYGLIRFNVTWSFLRGPWCWMFVSFRFK